MALDCRVLKLQALKARCQDFRVWGVGFSILGLKSSGSSDNRAQGPGASGLGIFGHTAYGYGTRVGKAQGQVAAKLHSPSRILNPTLIGRLPISSAPP